MDNEKDTRLVPGQPRYAEAIALENTVRAVRKAKGKKNPEDCAYGTPAWEAVTEDFLRDLLGASARVPDTEDRANGKTAS